MPSNFQISSPIVLRAESSSLVTQQFKSNPARFIANWLYGCQQRVGAALPRLQRDNPSSSTDGIQSPISIVCISDTHNARLSGISGGDILLHAGDLTNKGSFSELQDQLDWLNTLPHLYKVVIAGNHDKLLDQAFMKNHPELFTPEDIDKQGQLDWGRIIYLDRSSKTITIRNRSISIFGCPLTPQCGTFAFQHPPIRDVWKKLIPDGTDIVLTHGPPQWHLDQGGKGCQWLLRELWRIRPRAVVFGHIHSGRGREELCWDAVQKGYDFAGVINVIVMGFALGWSLIVGVLRRLLEKPRTGQTTLINAAVRDENDPAMVLHIY